MGTVTSYTKTKIDQLLAAVYTKPSNGIPATDLTASVQSALNQASSVGLTLPGPGLNVGPTTLPKWRAALAKARAGTKSAKVLCVGDSTTQGYHGPNQSNDFDVSWPVTLTKLLNRNFIPSVAEMMTTPIDASTGNQWTLGSGWALYSGYGFGQNCLLGQGSGALVFTPGLSFGPVDTFEIWYSTGANGVLSISIDGGSAVSLDMSPTPVAIGKKTVSTGSATTTHSLSMTLSSGAGVIFAVRAYNSANTNSVLVSNVAVSGTHTSNWNVSGATGPLTAIQAYAPDLTFINLGINNATDHQDPSAWETDIRAIIAAAQVSGDVIIESVFPSQSVTTNGATNVSFELAYKARSLNIAQSTGSGYLDLNTRFIDWTTANSSGLAFDNLHPSAAGYADIAQAHYVLLTNL